MNLVPVRQPGDVMSSALPPRDDELGGSSWLIVAAGLHFGGGMDKANAELASYLLDRGASVHIVAHAVDALFLSHPRARVHTVRRPLGSFALGEFGLERRGRRVAGELIAADPAARVVVNGGNCGWPDVNWVHYVHHAWTEVDLRAPVWFRVKHRAFSARWRRTEKASITSARLVIANSELTRAHVVKHLGVAPDRVRTVYLGADPRWGAASRDERAAARRWLEIHDETPAVAFVGALGLDRRKGFDTLLRAWTTLCSTPEWDAYLVVAGTGADRDALAAVTRQSRPAAARLRVLGHTERIKDLLAGVDLLVSPVRYEPYGLNVQEAICRGVPALVSRRAGVAERFPPELSDMLLEDPRDADELASRLRQWRAHMPDWKLRIEPLARELRSRSWEDMAGEFVAAVQGRTSNRPEALIARAGS